MRNDESKLPKWAQKVIGTERALTVYWKREYDAAERRLKECRDSMKPTRAD